MSVTFWRRAAWVVTAAALLALLLAPASAPAVGDDFFCYSTLDASALPGWGVYGVDGWVGSDGISRIAFYRLDGAGATGYVYQVLCAGDPNLHPDNPMATGPIAPRTFVMESFFDVGYYPGHECEFYYNDADGCLYLGAASAGVRKYAPSGGSFAYDSTVAPVSPITEGYGTQSLAYDPGTGTWYAGAISWNNVPGTTVRHIYKFTAGDPGWSTAFTYLTPDPTSIGTHHDGMEYVNGSLMIADYTGEYICKYSSAGVLEDTFVHQPLGHELEGMGYGALGHYWCGSHGSLINEFGGGRLTDNLGPIASASAVAANPMPVGSAGTLTALVDDTTTGASEIASAEYSVDGGPWVPLAAADGTFDEIAEDVSGGIGPFAAAGVYDVKVRGTDSAGNVGDPESIWLVVYDPNGGFVTGGGWIMSPEGAYVADPTLAGKATFGFVSKYLKGATVPTGNTEFCFHAAGMTFKSTSYQWLVIAGPKAQYKGYGTVNGAGEYGFILTAWDGQATGGGGVDMFRMKVWDKATGAIVYDSQLGAEDSSAPATPLGGGSIVVHKK